MSTSHAPLSIFPHCLLASFYLLVVGLFWPILSVITIPDRLLPLMLSLCCLHLPAWQCWLSPTVSRTAQTTDHPAFQRPLYDYRKTWMELTESTNSLIDIHDLCTAVASIVSKTFGILSVNIWLCDEAKERLSLAGSTVFTPAQATDLDRSGANCFADAV